MITRLHCTAAFRFKGQKKGGVTENASYYIFTQCADGAFEAFPVHAWYNFTPVAKHRTLTAEEAEEEWGRYFTHTRGVTVTSCPRGNDAFVMFKTSLMNEWI